MWHYFLQKSIDKATVRLNEANCLRPRYKGHSCRLCASVCPHNAISLEEQVRVDDGLCEACGLCSHFCPSGAMYLEDALFPRYEREIDGKAVACFTCIRQGGEDDILLPCLSALSPELLMLASLKKVPVQVFWQEEVCRECSFSWNSDEAEEWINAWNGAFAPRLQVDLIHAPGEKKGRPKAMTRSEYFSFARNDFKRQMGAFLFNAYEETVIKDKVPMSGKRRCLSRFMRHEHWRETILQPVLARKMLICGLLIKGKCNLCGRCAVLCPTGALRVEHEQEENKLYFNPLLCVDCDICHKHCDLLAKEEPAGLSIADLLATRVLASCAQDSCPRCGEAKARESEMCAECAEHNRKEQELLDSWLGKESNGDKVNPKLHGGKNQTAAGEDSDATSAG